jgi:ABC-type bacteriocin/lantibiotic exporter with double-glycine peptidase domain
VRVEEVANRQGAAELDAIRLDEALSAVYSTILSLGVVFIIWLGGDRVAAGVMSVGGLVAFLMLFVRFVTRAPRIPQMANRVQAAGAAYVRLEPLLAPALPISAEPQWFSFRTAEVPRMDERPPPASVGQSTGASSLAFEGVSFKYPGAQHRAIRDLDLEIGAGSFVAVTGPVGSGKSALARLAAGLYPPGGGSVLLDGRPPGDLEPSDRAARVGYLGQQPSLFAGTVASNVTLSPETTPEAEFDAAVLRAIHLACLDADVAAMPDGLNTEIGELGVRVSGGQRQRIGLARAIGAGGDAPGLLVLDEPFSAVDVRTEARIVAMLRQTFGAQAGYRDKATILLCSHRLAAFPLADAVVVLDQGRIEECGSHAELLDAGGLYSRIYRAQSRLASTRQTSTGAP